MPSRLGKLATEMIEDIARLQSAGVGDVTTADVDRENHLCPLRPRCLNLPKIWRHKRTDVLIWRWESVEV
jgi:hypothetical protein